MKIENWEGSLDTFTFPHNPNVIDDNIEGNSTFTNIGFQKRHIVVGGGGIAPKSVIINGHFDGATKDSDYQNLSKHFSQNDKLKKLYFESDKFYLGVGETIKQTQSGGRTNFVDYVANFRTILGILLDNTEDTSGTNDGNVRTFVTEITGTVTDGGIDVTLEDNHGSKLIIPNGILTTSDPFILLFVKMVNQGDGVFSSEYNWVGLGVDSGTTTSTSSFKLVQTGQNFSSTVQVDDLVRNTTDNTLANVTKVDSNTTLTLDNDIMASGEDFIIYRQTNSVEVDTGKGILVIDPTENVSTIITTNLTSSVVKYRDGWSA